MDRLDSLQQTQGKPLSFDSDETYTLLLEKGTKGGEGFGYTDFDLDDLQRDTVFVDGRRLSPEGRDLHSGTMWELTQTRHSSMTCPISPGTGPFQQGEHRSARH